MPCCKRRHSTTRRDKRRTHDKIVVKPLIKCPVTGVSHMPHIAYKHEGKMYYRGNVIIDDQVEKR